jgi:hypothetical protein
LRIYIYLYHMALQSSGPISISDVNVEIRKSSTAQLDLNNSDVRLTFEVPSGQISLSNGYGKCFCNGYDIIYDNDDGTVQFSANECNSSRTAININESGGAGSFWGSICIVKNSLNTSQNLLNYTNTGCC